jgi:hypothetical protein
VSLLVSLIEGAVELAFHGTARVLLPLCTFGWVRTEPVFPQPGTAQPFAVRRAPDGAIVLGSFLATIVGIGVWVAVAVLATAYLAGPS